MNSKNPRTLYKAKLETYKRVRKERITSEIWMNKENIKEQGEKLESLR
jgi:hypothetical protein